MKNEKNRILGKRQILYSYLITIIISLIVDAVICLALPSKYAAQVVISDEPKQTDILVGLNQFSAWVNNGTMPQNKLGLDNAEVYPKLLKSPDFIQELSTIQLPEQNCTLAEYISKDKDNPHEHINNNIQYSIKPFIHTITIQYTDKKPSVAYTVLDSLVFILQNRLKQRKVAINRQYLENAQNTLKEAEKKYKEIQQQYATFADMESDITLPSYQSKLSNIKKDRDNAFSLYQSAYQKVMRYEYLIRKENTSFSVVKQNYKPVSPISPKPIPYFFAILLLFSLINTWGLLLYNKMTNK